MAEENECICNTDMKLILSCSGAANVGELADLAARALSAKGGSVMSCLAGVGGRVPGIMMSVKAAARILAIDGCSLDCAKHCLEEAGITNIEHLRITDLGFEKGSVQINDNAISIVVRKADGILK